LSGATRSSIDQYFQQHFKAWRFLSFSCQTNTHTHTKMAPASTFHQNSKTVCVMDASGRLGSSMVDRLLQRGYTVHAAVQHHGRSIIFCFFFFCLVIFYFFIYFFLYWLSWILQMNCNLVGFLVMIERT
jgi:hypothetical protein